MTTHVTPLASTPQASRLAIATLAALVLALAWAGPAYGQGARGAPPAKPAPAAPAKGVPPAPAAQPEPDAEADSADATDIEALRQEYFKLREELFRSRARAAAVASAMYSTRLRIDLRYDTARFYTVTRATIRLDGANVYDDTTGAIAQAPGAPRFEGFVAPGRHVVSVRIEAAGKDDERFTSVTEQTFVIQAPAGKDVIVSARARDDGDIPYAWQKKERGSYKLGLTVNVEARKRASAPQDGPKAASR